MIFNRLIRTVDVAAEPVTVQEVKDQAKITTTADDTLIGYYLKAARMVAEAYMRRAIIDQTWQLVLDDQPEEIRLPMGNIESIITVKTFAEGGSATTESKTTTYEEQLGENGMVWLRTGKSWTITTRAHYVMEITYIAGYGASGANVPQDILQGVKMMAVWLYEHRGDIQSQELLKKLGETGDTFPAVTLAVASGAYVLLDFYRVMR